MGTLDTVMVNGPEGDVADWDAVDWARAEDDVRRLRQRIFTAVLAGDRRRRGQFGTSCRRGNAAGPLGEAG